MNTIEPGAPLPDITLTDGVITLRSFDVADLALVEDAATDDFIPKVTTVPAVFTVAAGHGYIERQHLRLATGTGWSLAIADRATGAAIGQIGLWITHLGKGRAEIGYWVAPSGRGNGAAARAVRLLSEGAFEHLDVHRLSLFIEPWNQASISTARRAGYDEEGLLRGWERVGGVPVDMLSFVRLRALLPDGSRRS